MSGIPPTYRNGKTTPGGIVLQKRVTQGFGTIGVISGERGSYASFWNCIHSEHMNTLIDYPGTRLMIQMGVDICGNLNQLVRRMEGDWLWIMGDDHFWEAGMLDRLLAHDVDVVVPHCLRRNPPWQPVVNSHKNEDGWYVAAELPEDELTEVYTAGSAGMLVRRRVFEALGDPYFTPSPNAEGLNEDMWFCERVHEAGFKVHCDPGALLGHISNYVVYPRWDENAGGWHVDTVFDQETRIPIRRIPEQVLA